jgi:hypothetical protein
MYASNSLGSGAITDTGAADGISVGDMGTLPGTESVPELGNAASPSLSSYLPKNLISSGLQSVGAPSGIANTVGGAAQGAGMSELQGGDPGTGALTGGFGGFYGGSVAPTIASGVSGEIGGGTLGNVLGTTASSAIGGAGSAAIGGGNAGIGGIMGGATGAIGSGIAAANNGSATGIAPGPLQISGSTPSDSTMSGDNITVSPEVPGAVGSSPYSLGSQFNGLNAGYGTSDTPAALGGSLPAASPYTGPAGGSSGSSGSPSFLSGLGSSFSNLNPLTQVALGTGALGVLGQALQGSQTHQNPSYNNVAGSAIGSYGSGAQLANGSGAAAVNPYNPSGQYGYAQRAQNPANANMTTAQWQNYAELPASQRPNGGNFFTPATTGASAAAPAAATSTTSGTPMSIQGLLAMLGTQGSGQSTSAVNKSSPLRNANGQPKSTEQMTAESGPQQSASDQYLQQLLASGPLSQGLTVGHSAGGYIDEPVRMAAGGTPWQHQPVPQPMMGNPYAAIYPQAQPMNGAQMVPHKPIIPGQRFALGGQPPFSTGGPLSSGYVQGPGDGQSDDIDAKLANGEFVLSADVVSALGNGSNDAGAKRLDEFMANVRKHASENHAKGKLQKPTKDPEHYLGEG